MGLGKSSHLVVARGDLNGVPTLSHSGIPLFGSSVISESSWLCSSLFFPLPRCENLAEMNILLREHLDKANEVNAALREDIRKLTADWTRAQDELELKKSEWHTEREVGHAGK